MVIGGPTATGKTGLAIELAEWLIAAGRPAEVISADSRQVYRGLDIGTAKATPEERRRVVHHGLDLVDPDQPFSVADFRAHALGVLGALGDRGGIGILAGGTGFWLRAVTAGLDTEALPSDAAVRAAIEADLARDGLESLAARLATWRRRSRRGRTCAILGGSSGLWRSPRSRATIRSRRRGLPGAGPRPRVGPRARRAPAPDRPPRPGAVRRRPRR